MGTLERREREKLETRRKIIDACRDLLLKKGYEGVTMRAIAEAIEYSPAAIYVHFADKEQLVRRLCEEDFEAFAKNFSSMDWSADPIERLRQLGRAYIRFGIQHPKHYLLMFMTELPIQPDDQCLQRKGDPTHDAYATLTQAVAQALADPRWQGETDIELVSQTLWAGVHGVTSMVVTMSSDPWIDWRPVQHRAELMVVSLVQGLMHAKLPHQDQP